MQRSRAEDFDATEDVGRNTSDNPSVGQIIAARFSRRQLLKSTLGVAAIAATFEPRATVAADNVRSVTTSRFNFADIGVGATQSHHVAEGYDADILIRWGDPVLPGAPAFDPVRQTAAAQKIQFGYNNDYLGYIPMPSAGNPSHHGLLVVNFEYTSNELMLPGSSQHARYTAEEIADIEMAAHGGAVIEIIRTNGTWRVIADSAFARRINLDTSIELTGPAAGHHRMKTSGDATGRRVLGMAGNCGGGVTPWGTWLSCEENFNGYFQGSPPGQHPEARNYLRYGVPGHWYDWGNWHPRFDTGREPNEANRFGWIVEIDPFDPRSIPKKRTALGRFKHEAAAGVVNIDGRYVIYSGDDERFEYVYRFVTNGRIDRADRAANLDLLDDGILSVARYNADGTADWLPLVHGLGPLIARNGFASQADVLIETRRAADLLGATKMDRPEDVQANPHTDRIYVSLTNNADRSTDQINPANPMANSRFGHLIEMIAPDGNHAADRFTWNILLKCTDPSAAPVGATFSSASAENGRLRMPDNLAVDYQGRLWVATDGNSVANTGRSDGLWGVETEGRRRGQSKQFFAVPVGAELTGPTFTPDDETLFVAVQHPGEGRFEAGPPGQRSTFDDPVTRWPDFLPDMPPRPAVVAITKRGGGKIAT
jgi:secreted PhoX family phosphatase